MKNQVVVTCALLFALLGCRDDESQGTNPPGVGSMSGLDAGFSLLMDANSTTGTMDASSGNPTVDAGAGNPADVGSSNPSADAGAPPPPPPTEIVINEIMYDPRAVADDFGEWVELTNIGSDAVDIQGWVLKDNFRNRHVISSSVIVQPGAYVVLGRSATNNGGYSADYVYGDDFLLKNSGEDAVILEDANGLVMDSVEYGTDVPWPVKQSGYSIELTRPGLNNVSPASWQLATQNFGDGDYGTPGLPNGGGNQSNSMIDATTPDWHQADLKASLYFAPNDPLQSIVLSHLEAAQTSIRMAFFNVRLNQVLTILRNKLAAGVDIKIILDKKQQDLFYNDMGERMIMAGLDVTLVERTEAMDSTMHNKFTIIDGKTVLTGSANYSHTAFNISDEDMIVMESTDLAARYDLEFDELLAGGDAVSTPYPPNSVLRAWMGPEDDLHDKVINLINSAQSQVLVAMFQLNVNIVVDALIAAKNRGVNVVVILDERQATQEGSDADDELTAAGINVVIADATGGSFAEMHSKFVTVDHTKLIMGSFNWTNLGAFFNDENIVEVDDPHLASRAEGKFAEMLNTYTSSSAGSLGLPSGQQTVSFEITNVTLGSGDKLFIKSLGGGPFDPAVEMNGTTYSTSLASGTSIEYVYEIRNSNTVLARETGNHAFTVPYAPGPFAISNAFLQ
ncbi:MAG: phospholipase D-like domain-containing protein [Myxococcota bacterium]|nr:phospholipase D-like domain-containing protein [Myxococcota bacterium]